MQDNDIKKALECCRKANNFDDCKKLQCPLYRECKEEHKPMEETVIPYALDLINRLETEKEDYKALYEGLKAEHIETIKAIKHYKADAYKEVFEKISDKSCVREIKKGLFCKVITLHDINTLKKEMVGEEYD